MEEQIEKQLKDLLCRHCDGIAGGEPCDIKDTCSVLRDAPGQIDEIYKQDGYRLPNPHKVEADTSKFELTPKEIAQAIFEEDCRLHGITPEEAHSDPDLLMPDGVWDDMKVSPEVSLRMFNKAICKAQVVKVLSLLGPVQLEALGALVNEALGMCSERSPRWRAVVLKLEETLATIAKNQKHQLYRIKEG